ncbi:MAG: hypothetical protein J07HX64_01822 [halophilic archaeon J07HX64]|jgi:hypothetical protein|nr:MAG: hypothetical protein J07HX64_01822 [halophilic archaeon J07HX64]
MEQFDTHPLTAGVTGTIVAVFLSLFAPPTVALGVGAVGVVTVVRSVDGYRQYAWAGTVFALLIAPLFLWVPTASSAYERTVFLSLVGFGLASLGLLLVRIAVRAAAGRALYRVTDKETRERANQFTAAIGATVTLAWGVFAAQERIARSGIVGILAPVTVLLDVAGISVEIAGFWILTQGIDLVLLVFVGTVLVGFHTLSSWHAFFHLRRTNTAQAVGRQTKQAASTATETSRDLASKARNSGETADAADVANTTETASGQSDKARQQSPDTQSSDPRSAGESDTNHRELPVSSDDRSAPTGLLGRLSGLVGSRGGPHDRNREEQRPTRPPEHDPGPQQNTGTAPRPDSQNDDGSRGTDPQSEEPPESRRGSARYCTDCGAELEPDTQTCPACQTTVDST